MAQTLYTIEKQEGVTIINFTLDTLMHQDNEEIKMAFTALLDAGNKQIILDLTKTPYISSLVIASFVFMLKKASEAGGALVICGLSDKVQEIFAVTNLDKVFDIVVTREDAVAKLTKK